MKVPKFMKNETPKKQFDNSTSLVMNSNNKLINTFKTIYFTPEISSTQNQSNWNSNIYNLTPTIAGSVNNTKLNKLNTTTVSITTNTNSASTRYTKLSQPKRLKRNRLLINAKFSINKNETPVKAYLNSKRRSMINENNNKLNYNEQELSTDPETPLKSPISIKKSFISRSPLSVLSSSSAVNNNEANITNSNSKLKNFVKNSFTNLHKLMSKSKTRLVAAKNSNNCSPATSPSSSSLSSDDSASPELKPQNLIYKYPQQSNTTRLTSCSNNKKRPIMGITALMLNNYNKQMATTSTTGFTTTTTTWPNAYLLGIPIVFQNTENNNQQSVLENKKPKTRNSKVSLSKTIDANNNNEEDDRNGFKLEIYGENVNESIRI